MRLVLFFTDFSYFFFSEIRKIQQFKLRNVEIFRELEERSYGMLESECLYPPKFIC